MWKLIPTGQFKKDLKRYRNKPEKLASLKSVLDLLQENGEVPYEYDFLLIWRDVDTQTISLVRIGTHSELFKK